MTTDLTGVVAEHIKAVNSLDVDAVAATFADDAYVNDNRREFNGIEAIRRWIEKEMIGDSVTIDPIEVIDHYGDTIVRGRYDGTYDKTNLPDELVLSNYFSVRDNKIVSLVIIFNQPAYCGHDPSRRAEDSLRAEPARMEAGAGSVGGQGSRHGDRN
jgi:hypothetical protein